MFRHKGPLIVGSLLILGMVAFVSLYRSSPGELARVHKTVAGSPLITDCKKCHAPQGLTGGCLQCHSEIQAQLDRHRGYHAYLAKNKKTECAPCHSEHNGSYFALISPVSWERKDVIAFVHPHVDFRLKGAHASLSCDQCHQAKNHSVFSLPKFPKFTRPKTYLGLSQNCVSCHADPHAGGRVTNCISCHDQNRWKPAPFFHHDKFFPLKGAHAHVSCSQCHAPPRAARSSSAPLKIFGPVKGTRCADCHANPHRVNWQRSCESCHKVDKPWSSANLKFTKELHALTGFHLLAPHDKVSCQKCHAPGPSFAQRYPVPRRAENRCESCHQDAHRGQFVNKYPQCVRCHTLHGWKPTHFGAPMHNQTSYPLIGGHLRADCNKCHAKDPVTKIRRYVHTPTDCGACHRDVHYGQFRKDNGKTRCETCHQSTDRWSSLVFNHETQSRFKLGEAHRKVACQQCHPLVSLPNGVRLVQYKPIKSQCSDCHGFDQMENH